MTLNLPTYSLPDGRNTRLSERAAIALWAVHFALAARGQGCSIKLLPRTIQITGVYSPLYEGVDFLIDRKTGGITSGLWNEQSSPGSAQVSAALDAVAAEWPHNWLMAARKMAPAITWDEG